MNKIQTSTPHFELVIEGIHKFVNDVLNSDNDEQKKKLRETIYEVARLLQNSEHKESKLLPNKNVFPILEIEKSCDNSGGIDAHEIIEFQKEEKIKLDVQYELFEVKEKSSEFKPVAETMEFETNLDVISIHNNSMSTKSRKRCLDINPQIEKKAKVVEDKIIDLPNELWVKIMNCINTKDVFMNFCLVCKKFNMLTSQMVYLYINCPNDTYSKAKYEYVKNMLKHKNNLKEIKINSNDNKHIKSWMVQAIKSNRNIKSIKLLAQWKLRNPFLLSNDTMKKINHFCKDLEHLELSDVKFNSENVSQIAQIKSLKSFKWSQQIGRTIGLFTPENIIDFANNCKNLETIPLYIDYVSDSDSDSFKQMNQAVDTFFQQRKFSLKSLIFNQPMLEYIGLCQNLEELFLMNVQLDTPNSNGVTCLTKLKKLILRNVTIGETFFSKLNTSKLKYLVIIYGHKIFGLQNAKFPVLERCQIRQSLSQLRMEVPDSTMMSELIANSPTLKSLQLIGDSFETEITDVIAYKEQLLTACKVDDVIIHHRRTNQIGNFGIEDVTRFTIIKWCKQYNYEIKNDDPGLREKFLRQMFDEWCVNNKWFPKVPEL